MNKPARFELHYVYPCGGYISRDGDDTGAFLQGDDYYQLEAQIDGLEKQVRHHRIGQGKANEIQDSILSEYITEV
jgi:hypothetical protein